MKNISLNEVDDFVDLRSLLERSATIFPQNTAFMELSRSGEVKRVSFVEFKNDVHALGTAFLLQGLESAHVALVGENSYAWVLAYFSLINIGATVIPLDRDLGPSELSEQMGRARTDAICYTPLYSAEGKEAVGRCGGNMLCIELGSLVKGDLAKGFLPFGYAEVASGNDVYAQTKIDLEKTCAIPFTSGTTGTSKGVMLSQKNLVADLRSACELISWTPHDILLSVLPLHHLYESTCEIFGSIYSGSAVVLCPSAKSLPKYLDSFSPTIMFLVPLYVETFCHKIRKVAEQGGSTRTLNRAIVLSRMLQRMGIDVSTQLLSRPRAAFGGALHTVICGGAPLDTSYIRFFRGLGINVLQGYGITECSPLVAVNRNKLHKDVSVGRIVSCCEVRIGAGGEVMVRGDNVMSGYLDDPEATEAAFSDGWFMTGDRGYVDADDFLCLSGRGKDIIVLSNGENIMPQEIEAKLTRRPSILEAVVVCGVKDKNGVRNLAAFIYPDWERVGNEKDAYAYLKREIAQVNAGLVYYKRIARFVLRMTPFEKTTTQKVKRFMLPETLEGMTNV